VTLCNRDGRGKHLVGDAKGIHQGNRLRTHLTAQSVHERSDRLRYHKMLTLSTSITIFGA